MGNNHQESNSFDDTYTAKPGMFGHPYKELQEYFASYPTRGTLLDLGSGQGRDALFLAGLGYKVIAIDSSKVGVSQMLQKAEEKGLTIKGIVADVLSLKLVEKFDIILFDMLLHAFEKTQQIDLLKRYSSSLNKEGIMCIVFPDDMKTDYFMSMLKSLSSDWKLLDEVIIKDVPKIEGEDNDFTFLMMVAQRIS